MKHIRVAKGYVQPRRKISQEELDGILADIGRQMKELEKEFNRHTNVVPSQGAPTSHPLATCRCPISDLLSTGHAAGCPEKGG